MFVFYIIPFPSCPPLEKKKGISKKLITIDCFFASLHRNDRGMGMTNGDYDSRIWRSCFIPLEMITLVAP
jgi:hypothetical protein